MTFCSTLAAGLSSSFYIFDKKLGFFVSAGVAGAASGCLTTTGAGAMGSGIGRQNETKVQLSSTVTNVINENIKEIRTICQYFS